MTEALQRGKWTTLIAVSIAAFMLLLDVTVVNVALPDIQDDLGASFNDLRWVIDSYALTLAATMLIYGSLGDRFGRRRVFVIGLAIFSLASLACGLAWDPLSLNIFRGLQGLGGAAMLATSLALIAAAYQGRDRSTALAVWGSTVAGAVALGPIIGGALVDGISWEAIFFVNVPIGLLTAALVARGVPETRNPEATGRIDFPGLVTLAGSMSLLVVAFFRGNEEGWGSPLIISLFTGSVLLLAAFIAIEARVRRPLLDLDLLRRPATAGASIAILAIATSTFAMLTFLVLYIQNALGYDAFETGLRLLPLTVASFFAGAATARLAERFAPRILIALGLALAGAGLLLNLQVSASSDWTALLAGGLLIGLGIGLINPSVAAAALGAAPVAKSGMASGLNSTFRILGVALGVAALGAIVESEVSASLAHSLGTAQPGLVDMVATGNVDLAVSTAPPELAGQVGPAAQQAFVSGLDTIFLVAAVIAFAGSLLSLLLLRERGTEGEPAGERGVAGAPALRRTPAT
jgi:EmrB/QacA subfamily drug resistance transporter